MGERRDNATDKGQSAVNQKDEPSLIKKSRWFKIAHLNIRSLIKHVDEFRIFLRNEQFDRISVNETMLDDTVCDHEITIKGHDTVRKDRISDHSLIYVTRKISIPRWEPKLVNTRQCKHYNVNKFKLDLREMFCSNIFKSVNPNELSKDWKEKIVTRRVRSEYTPWLTKSIVKKNETWRLSQKESCSNRFTSNS